MGSMNAMGHVLAASAGGVPELWDLLTELSERSGSQGAPGVHSHTVEERQQGAPRYCLHPTGVLEVEVKGDDLAELLTTGCLLVAKRIPEHEMWRRD